MTSRRVTGVVLGIVGAVAAVAYPFAIYVGLTSYSTRDVGLALLALLLPLLLFRLLRADRSQLAQVLPAPLAAVALVSLAVLVDDHRLMLALPVLVSGVLLVGFGASLRGERPMVERFARLVRGDTLIPAEVRYCRSVTVVWCVFFAVNGAVAGALAVWAPLAWWTVYAGALAYALIGAVFVIEFLVRSYRFRQYGPGLHDRIAARLFPPPVP